MNNIYNMADYRNKRQVKALHTYLTRVRIEEENMEERMNRIRNNLHKINDLMKQVKQQERKEG